MTAMAADPAAATAFGDLLIRAIDPDTALAAPWQAPSCSHSEDGLIIDNHGQSLLATGHVLVNLLGGRAGRKPIPFRVVGVREDHGLAGIALELGRYGIALAVDRSGEEIVGEVAIGSDPEALRRHHAAIVGEFTRHGRTVDATTFWNIYYRGNAGLDVDTPISRQHTGGTVLDVIRPGERITKQFTSEELHLLTDPDDLDNHNFAEFLVAH
jgi:hypothetical protein